MKKQCVFSVLFLAALLCASFPAHSLAAVPQQAPGFGEIALAVEARIAAAEESMLAGVAAVEILLKSAKTESSEMTGAWNTILEQHFQSSAVKELRAMLPILQLTIVRDVASGSGAQSPSAPVPVPYPNASSTGRGSGAPVRSAKSAQITLAIARDIYNDAKELAEFAQEIVSVGEAVAWTLKVNRHMQSLRFDIENAPVRVGVYVKEMRETSASLVNIISRIKRGVELRRRANVSAADLASLRNEVAQSIKGVRLMRNKTVNAALSLLNTKKYLEPGEGYAVPETEAKRIAVLAEYWRDAKNLYPLVRSDILEGVAQWAPLPKAKWEAYGETRKEFVETYGPLLAGKNITNFPAWSSRWKTLFEHSWRISTTCGRTSSSAGRRWSRMK